MDILGQVAARLDTEVLVLAVSLFSVAILFGMVVMFGMAAMVASVAETLFGAE